MHLFKGDNFIVYKTIPNFYFSFQHAFSYFEFFYLMEHQTLPPEYPVLQIK